MTDPEDKIHVMPVAPNDWEVEVQSGDAVSHEPTKEAAIAVALDVARQEGVETVIVHDGDGVTEELHSAFKPTDDHDDPAFDCSGEAEAILRSMPPAEREAHLKRASKLN